MSDAIRKMRDEARTEARLIRKKIDDLEAKASSFEARAAAFDEALAALASSSPFVPSARSRPIAPTPTPTPTKPQRVAADGVDTITPVVRERVDRMADFAIEFGRLIKAETLMERCGITRDQFKNAAQTPYFKERLIRVQKGWYSVPVGPDRSHTLFNPDDTETGKVAPTE